LLPATGAICTVLSVPIAPPVSMKKPLPESRRRGGRRDHRGERERHGERDEDAAWHRERLP